MTDATDTKRGVLIVDDDPILSAIAQVFFQKRGWGEVHTASNGRKALDFMDGHTGAIDFILCDLNMPEMDGIEFLRHLKERAYLGAIAILSGERDVVVKTAGSLAASHNLNIVGALKKPLKIVDLETIVGQLGTDTTRTMDDAPILLTVNDLRIALASGHIIPHYQPKVSTVDGAPVGVEALARWQHPGFGLVGPVSFIPMAEQNGLIEELTEVMISAALHDMQAMRRRGIDIKMSVNLSAASLSRLEFPDELAWLLDAADLQCGDLVLEVTESNLVQKTATSTEVLARLCMMGFGISIDDFGTGYSNMEQLREFPFTELKVDQSFIREASHDQFAQASVEASIKLGKQLDLRIVAEGVENSTDWDYVCQAGVDEVQGFYIAKPMPMDELVPWLDNRAASRLRVV